MRLSQNQLAKADGSQATSLDNLFSGRAKAYAKMSATTATVTKTMGVSSTVDNGTGNFTVNWSTAFASASAYAALVTSIFADTGTGGDGNGGGPRDYAAGSVRMITFNSTSGVLRDGDAATLAAFGDF